ncbi:hypothetical protein ACS0TY_006326 [Phlomoides rotata]
MEPLNLANSIISCRQREDDDKWEHDLFDDNKPEVASMELVLLVICRRVGPRDLRLKLQRKSIDQERGFISGGVMDLREKLSGALYSRPVESKPPLVRLKPAPEASKPPRKSVIAQAPAPKIKPACIPKKASQQKVEVDNFLKPLGLEKYSITFQAEEVDMTALVHMSDEDLKAMGIPMVILALLGST